MLCGGALPELRFFNEPFVLRGGGLVQFASSSLRTMSNLVLELNQGVPTERSTTIGLRNICPLHCENLLSSWRKIGSGFALGPALRAGLALRARCLNQREGHKLQLHWVHKPFKWWASDINCFKHDHAIQWEKWFIMIQLYFYSDVMVILTGNNHL